MEHIVKPCRKCGQPLEIKRNRETGEEFFGCSMWPVCTHTEPLPEAIKLRRQGQPDMFSCEFVNHCGEIEDETTGATRPMTPAEKEAWERR